jgi:hypothetical protein
MGKVAFSNAERQNITNYSKKMQSEIVSHVSAFHWITHSKVWNSMAEHFRVHIANRQRRGRKQMAFFGVDWNSRCLQTRCVSKEESN